MNKAWVRKKVERRRVARRVARRDPRRKAQKEIRKRDLQIMEVCYLGGKLIGKGPHTVAPALILKFSYVFNFFFCKLFR